MSSAGQFAKKADESGLTLNDTFCSDDSSVQTAEDKPKRTTTLKPLVSYEAFMWVVSWTIIIIAIADRFHWQVWPRNAFTLGGLGWGSDRDELKPGPWSVKLYDIIARISGRHAILCYNLMLITRLESWEWIFTNSKIIQTFIDTSNIVNANLRLHAWNGIGLCVLTLLHVWSILFPCLTDGYTAVMVPGYLALPISERTPDKCGDEPTDGCWPGDANVELKQMGLQADDVFRLVEMTLFLAILMPLSIRWLASRWHAGMFLHRVINIVYFVDIVRRHSHPHSWVLNTPVFVLYCFDKLIWANFWRRNANPTVERVKLSEDFIVLYWKSPFGKTDTIGPDYALRLNDSSFLEDKHVFTCFENRCGVNWSDKDDTFDWNVGVVIRVFRNARKPALGAKDTVSHTWRMYDTPNPSAMLITGPRQGEMSEVLKRSLLVDPPKRRRVVAVGAGSAVNYLIDCLQWSIAQDLNVQNEVSIVYTTRDFSLFLWSKKVLGALLEECEERKVPVVWDVTLAFTGKVPDSPQAKQWFSFAQEDAMVKVLSHRVDLESVIEPGSVVFCQGSAGLKTVVEKASKRARCVYYGGRGGADETATKGSGVSQDKNEESTSRTEFSTAFSPTVIDYDISDEISV